MKIKRFTGTDMRDAMRQVREAFGPDAVILESGRAPGGIEISAAMDFDPVAWQRSRKPAPRVPAARIDLTDDDFDTVTAASDSGATDDPVESENIIAVSGPDDGTASEDVRCMRDEMRGIRSLLEAQLKRVAWDDQTRRNPESVGIMRNLTSLGIDPDIVQRLVQDVDTSTGVNAWTTSLRQLVDELVVSDADLICDGGIFAIVGPTGVGKTTTIAKLAARYLQKGRPEDLALVTTDTFRIGAREQLETFGRIMGVPVYQARDAASLSATLARLSDRKLVLIDTAGMSQRDVRLARELACLADAEQDIQVLLALPANAQADSMQEIVDAFLTARPAACILTKLDEATSLGGAFSVLIRSGLPLAYVANGQRVPEDLHFARARQAWLVKAALELMRCRTKPVSDNYMAEHFAEGAANVCA